MNIEQLSIGIFLTEVLSNFGLITDENHTTSDKLVLSSLDSNYKLTPRVEFVKDAELNRTKFICGGNVVFSYSRDTIYLSEPIKSHELLCKILKSLGWVITPITNEQINAHRILVSSAISPVTYNSVLVLSDHEDGMISETRLNYFNSNLLCIAIKKESIMVYSEYKKLAAAMYDIVVEDKK